MQQVAAGVVAEVVPFEAPVESDGAVVVVMFGATKAR